MTTRTGRFRRSDRVRRSIDYRRISRTAARHGSREFVVLVAPMGRFGRDDSGRGDSEGDDQPTSSRRLGLTVSRKVGNAVARNHVKRLVREWFRAEREALPENVDVVVIAKPGAAELDTPGVRASLWTALANPSRPRRRRGRHG